MRSSAVLIAGLAALPLLVAPRSAVTQSGFHPRWEIPGFDFRARGAWRVRAGQVAQLRHQMIAQNRLAALNSGMLSGPAPSATQVRGTIIVPALLFSYADVPAQFLRDTSQYTSLLFGAAPPGGNPYTLRTFYEQMSNGVFSMRGKMIGWVVLDSNEITYTGTPPCNGPPVNPFGTHNCNGLFSADATSRMQTGFRQALARVDVTVDFSQFDNDGPDLIPNSGDDDGYVDMIMFAYPTKDGACGGISSPNPPGNAVDNNHIWSHRYVLVNASGLGYQDYITNDLSAKPGFGNIRISDYFATTALGGASACDTTAIMPIGTAAHEFGHALGLPDLYATQGSTEGIGEWGLMGSGNFTSPKSPSRMEAWSLNELGWVTLAPLTSAGTYSFGAAPVSDTAFYLRVQGANPRGEYFLVENRQASQADTALIRIHCARSGNPPGCGGGLLIYHVDSEQVANNGFHASNAVNVGPIHGVELEEADGLRQLWCEANGCNRGDAGDPYPGTTGHTFFTPTSTPAAVGTDGQPAGFSLDQITQLVRGGAMSFRLTFPVWVVRAAPDTSALIQFDGVPYRVFRGILAQSSTHTVAVDSVQFTAGGRTQQRFGSWSDQQPRSHIYTAGASPETLTVTLARSHRLDYAATNGGTVTADTGGTIVSSGTFFADGTPVTLTATAGALPFLSWAGDTVSKSATITLPLGRPYNVRAVFLAPLSTGNVVSQLLGGTGLTAQQQLDLDQLGNSNGAFDIGDFLAWVKATGAAQSTAVMAAAREKGSRR